MCAFSSGTSPVVVVTAVAALALAGCSSSGSNSYTAENAAVAPPRAVAQAVTETEADGLPSQTPPVRRVNEVPDDPNEPYSRNYGGPNPSRKPLAKPEPENVKPVPRRVPTQQAAVEGAASRPYWKVVSAVTQDE